VILENNGFAYFCHVYCCLRNPLESTEMVESVLRSRYLLTTPCFLNPRHKYLVIFPVKFRDIAVCHLFTPVCLFRSSCLGSFREIPNKAYRFTSQWRN